MADIPSKREVNEMIANAQRQLQKTLDNTIVMGDDNTKPSADEVNVYLGVLGTSSTIDPGDQSTIPASKVIVDNGTKTLDTKLKEINLGISMSQAKPDYKCIWIQRLSSETEN